MSEEFIVARNELPDHLLARIHSARVMVRENDGNILLTPLSEKQAGPCRLLGMLAGRGVSTEAYHAQKQQDKELE